MKARIGDWEFDEARYDAEADVLYLSIGAPREAVGSETPEGHILRFAEDDGSFCGVTIIDYRRILDADGVIDVTVPHRERVEIDDADLQLAGA